MDISGEKFILEKEVSLSFGFVPELEEDASDLFDG